MPSKYLSILRDLGIKQKIIAGISLMLLTVILSLSLIYINRIENFLITSQKNKARLFNKSLLIVFQNAMIEGRYSFIQELVEDAAANDPEIKTLVIFNQDAQIVASSREPDYPVFSGMAVRPVLNAIAAKKNFHAYRPDKKVIESVDLLPETAPSDVKEKNGGAPFQTGGGVYLVLSTEYLSRTVRSLWIYSCIIAAAFLVPAFFGAYLFGRYITGPVLDLARWVRGIAAGDYGMTIVPRGRDEIGRLTADVDRMRGSIRDLTENLEEKVSLRTAQLEAANRELESFSYSVSHDLRAPLRAIDGFALALIEDYSGRMDDTGLNYLERMRKASQRMGELIDAILALSRLTRGDMTVASVNLSDSARRILDELRERDPARSVECLVRDGVTANGDAKLLVVAMENLLGNAWKYSSKKEKSVIEFGARDSGKERIYFVRDNGAGFDMEYAGRLFTAFQRLHANAEFEGIGIGLATVQRIIHLHGGRIWAESEVGRGAVFYFTLP